MRTAVGAGFRSIAGFIFGKNEAAPGAGKAGNIAMTSPVTLELPSEAEAAAPRSEAVAMTSPVTAEMAGDGTYKARRPPARPPAHAWPNGYSRAPRCAAVLCAACAALPGLAGAAIPPHGPANTNTPCPSALLTHRSPSSCPASTPRTRCHGPSTRTSTSRRCPPAQWRRSRGTGAARASRRRAALGRLGTACARQRASRPAGLGLYQSSSSAFRFRKCRLRKRRRSC